METRKISPRRSHSSDDAELGHFTLLFCRGRLKKCTKIYNARVQLLFCSLNLLFSDVFVAVVVVVCLSCLFKSEDSTTMFNLKGSGPRHNQRSARNSIPSSPRPLSKFLPCPWAKGKKHNVSFQIRWSLLIQWFLTSKRYLECYSSRTLENTR